MKIKEIKNQNRRDFTAIYQCEHCGHEHEGSGYDDSYFHQEVVPNMKRPECKLISPKTSKPRAPKYRDGVQV